MRNTRYVWFSHLGILGIVGCYIGRGIMDNYLRKYTGQSWCCTIRLCLLLLSF